MLAHHVPTHVGPGYVYSIAQAAAALLLLYQLHGQRAESHRGQESYPE